MARDSTAQRGTVCHSSSCCRTLTSPTAVAVACGHIVGPHLPSYVVHPTRMSLPNLQQGLS